MNVSFPIQGGVAGRQTGSYG